MPPADTNECLRVLRPRTSSGNLLSSNAGASSGPTSDYLIPLTGNHRSSTSDLAGSSAGGDGPEQCGYWETSFTREGVKAIARGEPVPTPEANGSVGNLSLGDLRSGSGSSRRRRSKGYATVPTFEAPTLSQSQSSQPLLGTPPDSPPATDDGPSSSNEPLDASTLCRQSYANVRIANASAGSTPSRATPPSKAERAVKQNEINCWDICSIQIKNYIITSRNVRKRNTLTRDNQVKFGNT